MVLLLLELNTEIENYLDNHKRNILKKKSTSLTCVSTKNMKITQNMSVKGAIKRTRSFMLAGKLVIFLF